MIIIQHKTNKIPLVGWWRYTIKPKKHIDIHSKQKEGTNEIINLSK